MRTKLVILLTLSVAALGCSFQAKGSAHAGSGDGEPNTAGGEAPKAEKGDGIAAKDVDPTKVDRTNPEPQTPAPASTDKAKPKKDLPPSANAPTDRQPEVKELDDKTEKGEKEPKVVKQEEVLGEPTNLGPRAATAVWVWYDEATKLWHIRTTAKDGRKVFRGRVGVLGGKAKLNVVKSNTEGTDRYLVKPQAVHFAFLTTTGVDGLDLSAEGGKCLYFRFLVDDQPATEVYLGKDNTKLDFGRFRVCATNTKKADKVGQGIPGTTPPGKALGAENKAANEARRDEKAEARDESRGKALDKKAKDE